MATAIATFQDVQIARAHPSDDLARTVSHVKGQYDAFNRLMQVNLIGSAVLNADGQIASGELGPLTMRYRYDGLGRLVRKTTLVKSGHENLQAKDYYYDGVRRIQEVVTRAGAMPGLSQNDELPEPSGGSAPSDTATWTDREYVWGPDYVDECVVQIDRTGAAMYAIQDANYNVVALTNSVGAMLEQYTYDPYGTLRVAETYPPPHAVNRIGHQGLFYDRFDGTIDDPSLEPNAVGLYYNRNRVYFPHLGKFGQRDPDGTSLMIIANLAMLGDDIAVSLIPAGLRSQYVDGLSLYQYARANPIRRRDPSGLFSLAELSGASALSMDLESNNADLALAALGGIKGLVGFVNYRNLLIADALGSDMYEVDSEGIDTALGLYESYQRVQSALLVGGLIKAGAALGTIGFAAYAYDAYAIYRRAKKAINLPAWRRLTVDWAHILSGHVQGGTRAGQSGKKSLFPPNWSQRQIENAVKDAYAFSQRVQTQGPKVKLQGSGGGLIIEMWVNLETKVLETAYPIGQ